MTFEKVQPQIDFPKQEEEILAFWKKQNIFQKSIEQRAKEKSFSFYDGPPFATGLPHYGHLLASVLKDIIPRYWTMKGYRIERRFGWDCHGLPVEHEIDKDLGIRGRADVEAMGIKKYNEACRSIVLRYTAEWERTISRIGRWVDFKNDYKTMDRHFMESVWWGFKQLWEKKLIYEGFRVMPYSTAVATPLSNFEAGLNYKDVQDPAITVMFALDGEPNTFFLVWTTTPWTLPSNLALAVNPELEYVKVKHQKTGVSLILGAKAFHALFKKDADVEIVNTFLGKELVGKTYEPLFSYFASRKNVGAFRVLAGEFVTEEEGTSIVHIAPAFGEDDFQLAKKHGIEIVLPVDDDGKFTDEVKDFSGKHVKEADKEIIAWLKHHGKLFRHDTITHSYPFCWRSDTPLIYRAVSSWFLKVEAIKERLIQNNQKTHWVPENLRDGRFGNWLENARDWNISRNRYWGNPLPVWRNDETGEMICIGSIAELEKLSGKKVTDLHRESLDDIEIPNTENRGVLKRIPQVFDCWFESGAMPFAQYHYPFEHKETFEKTFPADFIAEGLDQTRGWFYTLSVLGTALFDTAPFQHVVVNGLVLAEDGKKMSKRLKNYPDPETVINAYGADALRLYLINSPAVRAEELRFSEAGVKEIVRRVLLKWWNAYTFFISYATIDQWKPGTTQKSASALLDQWILSRLQTLLNHVEVEMKEYHLYSVVPQLLDFIENLTNIYIRLNRKRFWSEGTSEDKEQAYQTLYTVLLSMTKTMAPFAPFLSETMFQNLRTNPSEESVHLQDYPVADKSLIIPNLERSVALMARILVMGRNLREQKNIKIKIPLKQLSLIHRDKKILEDLKPLESYLKEELNVRHLLFVTDEASYVELTAKANGATLGPRLGKKFGAVSKAIQQLSTHDIASLEKGELLIVESESLSREDVTIYRNAKPGHENLISDAFITIELDTTVEKDQMLDGLAREVVNRIQRLRKKADLKLDDRIVVEYAAEEELLEAITKNLDYIQDQTLAIKCKQTSHPQGNAIEECEIDEMKLTIALKTHPH
ncbi:MAG: isoleucine--tRNA ligase [Deltaproteobacteria bacterium RIFCSPLOWO2_02_FULL_44_10]|nr:MAG: isoleucine--tRNA ligase [Deltaproteobacteria bacterium RIFCSPHIGHO2_02_FULL_44_16]OGQ46692.1 MAG: isoleucine--tRNA ligase [Deltaproteobacteria bacterium RIFCSPLOWO2_02_FULL_44_10]